MTAPVTIIIPTYNRARSVGAAIDSALLQEYPDLSIVVVDDGSTDNTRDVLSGYAQDPRITVVYRRTNGGVLAAKNTGLDSLPRQTRYFGILDSDDVLLPGTIPTLVDRFESSTSRLSQVFGWCVDAESGEPTGRMTHKEGLVRYEDALCGRFSGEFWQLVDYELLGQMRFDERGGGLEAMVWWPLLRIAPAGLVDVVVRKYDRSGLDRVNRPSFSQEGARRKMRGVQALLERVGEDMARECPQHHAEMLLEQAKWAALAGERSVYNRSLETARLFQPSRRVFRVGLLRLIPHPTLRRLYAILYRNAR